MGTRQRRRKRDRAGFTLIEILTVITIIAVLMTLTMKVVGAVIDNARQSATVSTLTKIQSLMNSRRQAFNRLTLRKGFVTNSSEYALCKTVLGLTGQPQRIVAGKILQMKYFPQSQADLNWLLTFYAGDQTQAATLQFVNLYPTLFQQPFVLGQTPVVLPNLTNQEILYNVLTENSIGDSPTGPDSFTAQEVQAEPTPQLATAGKSYFVDAWKNPIRFYRWPTRLFRSDGINISATDVLNARFVFSALPVFTGNLQTDLGRDPDDPLQMCGSIAAFESNWHTPATFHMPLIVSPGPDGQLGMGLPDSATFTDRLAIVTNQDQLTDNIVSASIKAGGK